MPTPGAAWSSASVFNLRTANLAGFVPPEEQEQKMRPRRGPDFGGFLGMKKREIRYIYPAKGYIPVRERTLESRIFRFFSKSCRAKNLPGKMLTKVVQRCCP
jgi:hypothetical protein